jgi:Protein of unknown function (DUF3383)
MSPTLPLSNIINVNVFFPSTGLANFNVNNIALFTSDNFLSNPGNNTYRIYQSAQQVGIDFGTTTETYQQAVAVFIQQPSIPAGGGSLIIFPSFQNNSISSVTVGGSSGTGYVIGDVLTITQGTAYGGTVIVTSVYAGAITGITLSTGGQSYSVANNLAVTGGTGTGATIDITSVTTENLAQAIARTANMIYYCGIISTNYGTNTTWQNLGTVVQSFGNKLLFLVSSTITDITNAFTNIQQASLYFTRCLYYSTSGLTARLFAASYASRLLSVNFNGSLTAITMNGKQLLGVIPDPGMTQTTYGLCNTAGVDIYTSFNNSPATVSNGANLFADRAFNLIWFVTSLQVAGYNALQTSATKVPQTTNGMNSFVGALKQVCQQGVINGYLAPGQWTGVDTFGNQTDFLNNISTYGYYIYFIPIAQQTAAQRTARTSPLVSIAIKEAGAIQSAQINIYDQP